MEKLLIIGAGSIGRRHLANFHAQGVPKIACADPRQDHLELAQKTCALYKTYSDYKIALQEEHFDGVVISAPTGLHVDMALCAAEAGCHIFIEKPISHNLDSLDKLIRVTKEKDLTVFVAYCHRFIPSVEKLKKLIDGGVIGKIYAVNMNWGSYLPNWHPWEDYRSFYMAKQSQGGGALLDESHGVDLLRYLFGEIIWVSGDVGTISHLEIDSDDWASMLFHTQKGIRGKAHFDLIRHDPQVKMEILGEKGTLTWDRIDHKITIYHGVSKTYEIIPYTLADVMSMYTAETSHFIDCVNKKLKTFINLEDGVRTMKVIDAVFKSSESGQSITISYDE